MQAIYADGGVATRNPSEFAATWAWCLVDEQTGAVLRRRSGILVPQAAAGECFTSAEEVIKSQSPSIDATWRKFPGTLRLGGRVTNNHAELYAVVDAMSAMEDKWAGVIRTDSVVTIKRLNGSVLLNPSDIPTFLIQAIGVNHRRLGPIAFHHVKGHPNRHDLAAGVTAKGVPVSKYQAWCDRECCRLRDRFVDRLTLWRMTNDMNEREKYDGRRDTDDDKWSGEGLEARARIDTGGSFTQARIDP